VLERDLDVDAPSRFFRFYRDVARDLQRSQAPFTPPPVDGDVPSDAMQPGRALSSGRHSTRRKRCPEDRFLSNVVRLVWLEAAA
jgi:hypothetical protein